MTKLTESSLRKIIKEELRKVLNEDVFRPKELFTLNLLFDKLASVQLTPEEKKVVKELSDAMIQLNVPPTGDIQFADYGKNFVSPHTGAVGEYDVYTRKGFIGTIPRELGQKIGIPMDRSHL